MTLPSNPNQPIRKWRSDFSLHENMITEGEGKMLSKDYVNRILSSAEASECELKNKCDKKIMGLIYLHLVVLLL